jgi:hypothetical protein
MSLILRALSGIEPAESLTEGRIHESKTGQFGNGFSGVNWKLVAPSACLGPAAVTCILLGFCILRLETRGPTHEIHGPLEAAPSTGAHTSWQ